MNIPKSNDVFCSGFEICFLFWSSIDKWDLSKIESKLINKIKNYSFNKVDSSRNEKVIEKLQPEKNISFDIGLFMMKWSNKFVFISLLAISAIALTKQAWA